MQGIQSFFLTGQCNASGVSTFSAPSKFAGWIYAVEWYGTGLGDSASPILKISSTKIPGSVRNVLALVTASATANNVYRPRVSEQSNAGADLGTYTLPYIAPYEQMVLTIASGGLNKTGGCIVHYFE